MYKSLKVNTLTLILFSLVIHPAENFAAGKTVHQRTLSNGMRVFIQNIPEAYVSTVLLKVDAGSIHETERTCGISRLVEWILFRSSERFTDVQREIDAYGGRYYSYTHPDMISFQTSTAAPYIWNMVDIFADVMTHPVISDSLFEQTKAELVQRLSYELSSPRVHVVRVLLENLFKVHPYRFDPLGDPETITGLTIEDVRSYFNDLYTPENMVLVVVGSFDPSDMLEKVEDSFGLLERTPGRTYRWDPEPEQKESREIVETHSLPQKVGLVTLGWQAPSINNRDTYALDVLLGALETGNNARLKLQLTDRMEGVYYAWAQYYTPREPGYFFINAICDPSIVQAVKDTILKEIDIIRKDSITPNELRKCKMRMEVQYIYQTDSPSMQANFLGYWSIMKDYNFAETYVSNLKRVSLEDIRHIAKRYFRADNYTATILVPR